jgi:arylsulfatase A-like enzyme
VWVHLVGPHLPYSPGTLGDVDYTRLYAQGDYAGPADGSREFTDRAHGGDVSIEAADVQELVALYDGEIARIDRLVSGFVAFCSGRTPGQPRDVLAQSLFVLTADHGEELFERHGYFGHSKSVYEPVLRVPLILRHPGTVTAGRRIEDLVGLEDLTPTILDLFRAPAEPKMHGISLAHVLRGGLADPRTAIGMWNDRIFTARTGRWRLVWNPDRVEPDDRPPGSYPIPEVALFEKTGNDPQADVVEAQDLSAAHADVVTELKRAITAWRQGLDRCVRESESPTPERIRALQDMGYAGGDR